MQRQFPPGHAFHVQLQTRSYFSCAASAKGSLFWAASGVFQHGNGRAGHVGGRHRELGAASLDPLVVALDVVGVEHGPGLALLKHRLLIRFGRGVVVQRQLQLSAVRLLGRGHGQPAKWALTEIGLLGKAQYLRIEAQGLVLVVHVDAGHFDFHFASPLPRSRLRNPFGLRLLEGFDLPELLRATAWRTSALKADPSTSSPSWMSIARRTFPSRLELKRRAGSFRDAPLAKVKFMASL